MARSAPLDREKVVRVAADLADREGWPAVTLSRVAKEVDRHVTTLYAHVESLADLKREVAVLALDELGDEAWRAALGRTGPEALRAIAEVYRDFGLTHPGRTAAMHAADLHDHPAASARGARLAEPIRATLRSFGLDADRVAAAHRIFSATILGLARPGGTQADLDEACALFEIGLSSGRWPLS